MENQALILPLGKWVQYGCLGALALIVCFAIVFELVLLLTGEDHYFPWFGGYVIIAATGAGGGVVFAALWPLRRLGLLGYSIRWTAAVWIVLYVILSLEASYDGIFASEFLDPLGIVFWILAGALLGYFLARIQLRGEIKWSSRAE